MLGESPDQSFHPACSLCWQSSARVGLPQANDFPLPIDFTFNTSARPALFDGSEPSPKQLHAIQLAVEKLRLKRAGLSS